MNLDSAFFLFCFFPALAAVYALVPRRGARNWILLIASLLFCSFGGLYSLLVLLAAAAVTFLAGLGIRSGRSGRLWLAVGVVFDLALLAGFKSLEKFTLELDLPEAASLLLFAAEPKVRVLAPLGVSFFVFRCVSYLADAHRDRADSTSSFPRLLLYVSFLPQLVSGPIARFRDFAPQLDSRPFDFDCAARGLRRLIRGMGKKLILASAAGAAADAVFALPTGDLDIRLAWLGAAAYALQLFFDFSGYSDMAIGLGGFFGFDTPENFVYPYAAGSITDFWRRWHISLSLWFRDYVYIPLGGNRRGKWRTALNKFIVFALCGIWHGFGLTFLLWGVWHGVLSALESLRVIDTKRLSTTAPGRVLCHVYALLAVAVGFVMFRASTAAQGFAVIGAMFTGFRTTAAGTAALCGVLNARTVAILALGAVLSVPTAERIRDRFRGKLADAALDAGYVLLLALCMAELAAGGFSPFIYAQF